MYKLGLHKRRCLSLVYRSGNGHNWLATSSIFPTSFHPPRPDALTHTAWPDDTGWAARATVGEASSFAGYNHSLLVNDHRYNTRHQQLTRQRGCNWRQGERICVRRARHRLCVKHMLTVQAPQATRRTTRQPSVRGTNI